MSNKFKKWTDEEDLVIISKVKENPTNLSEAFRQASKELERSYATVRARWYTCGLKNKYGKIFMLVGPNTITINGKVTHTVTDNTIPNSSMWTRLLKLYKRIFK